MNDNLKSLAQIAAELELTKQAVYKRVNSSPDVLERLQAHTITNGKRKYYTLHGQKIIKDLFPLQQSQQNSINGESGEPKATTENDGNTAKSIEGSQPQSTIVNRSQQTKVNSEQPTETAQAAIAALEQQLEVLQQQLEIKDKQIEQLTDALSNTTTALTAAQALHAGTIQQQLTTEQQPQSELDVPTDPEGQEEQPAPKKSLFARLFKRK